MATYNSAEISDFRNSNNPDPSRFIEYLSTMKLPNPTNTPRTASSKEKASKPSQYLTLPTSPDVPVYAIKNRVITRGKPDLELHHGHDLNSPITAVGRIHLRNHGFGLPAEKPEEGEVVVPAFAKDGIGEELMTWENLNRVTRWTEKIYGFEWGIGRERKSYTWLRTKPTGVIRSTGMKELELRIGATEEAERGGECIAKWVRGKGPKTLRKGSLYVQNTGNSVENSRLEHVVIITFLIVLEIFVRKGGG